MRKIFLFIFTFFTLISQAQISRLSKLNFSSFTSREKKNEEEIKRMVDPTFWSNPDLGYYPANAQRKNDFIELIDRRDAYSRFMVEKNSKGNHFISQHSYTPLNYKDSNGYWLEINFHLEPTSSPLVFVAQRQRNPVTINLEQKNIKIENGSHTILLGNDLQLVHIASNGTETSFGKGNWDNFTAGDDGIYFHNFYKDIDLVFILDESKVEINFVINKKLALSDGVLVMKQGINLAGNGAIVSNELVKCQSQNITDNSGNSIFTIDKCIAFTNDGVQPGIHIASTMNSQGQLMVYTPVNWLNDSQTIYPVVIDPIVNSVDSLLAAAIMGTKFSPVCWTNSCDYSLNVATPANVTITTIYNSFGYQAISTCFGQDGGYSIDMGGCHWPSAAPGVFTCNFPIPMFTCLLDTNPISEFVPCFPAPSCAPQNLNFMLHFFRCNHDPDLNCLGNCIRAAENWIVEIEGRTLELNFFTPNMQVCGGANVNLVAAAQYGVPPYSYSWNSSVVNNDTLTVSPIVTTPYSVIVTDQCANTVSAADTITVEPNNNPGFTISPITACVNSAINLSGNGAGLVTNYDWIVPGSNAAGGVIADNQNPIINYSLPGTYNITLRYYNANCSYFDSTLSITITSLSVPNVNLITNSVGPFCQGDTIRFSATPTNGGANPTYDWIVDGTLLQSGIIDTFSTAVVHNGSIVQVVLHSNSSCITASTDTSATFIALNSAVVPTVTISPDTSVCPNSPVTFNATVDNGGANPQFQWYVNGSISLGATGSSFSTTIGPNDSLISVQLTSSLRCVTTSNTTDTSRVTLLQNVVPLVSISSDASSTICQGDTIHFDASPTFGGSSPLFQWFVNGVSVTAPSANSNFTFVTSNLHDSISVRLTSSLACLAAGMATNFTTVDATSQVTPSVTISHSPPVVCEGQVLTFTAVPNNGGSSPIYTWSVNGNSSGAGVIFLPGVLQNKDTVSVTMTTSISCATIAQVNSNFIVNNLITPVANFTYENPYVGAFLNTIAFTNTSVSANSFVWYFVTDSDTAFVKNPVHQFPGQGSFDVVLLAMNNNGCIDSVQYTVVVQEEVAVFFPKAFTPNGDNINELFHPIGASLGAYTFYIYNRWGELIFTGNEKKPWSGFVRDSATPAPDGVYVYRLEVKDLILDEKVLNGRVTLIR